MMGGGRACRVSGGARRPPPAGVESGSGNYQSALSFAASRQSSGHTGGVSNELDVIILLVSVHHSAEIACPLRVRLRRWMKSIRREHSSLSLLAHEREEIDPARTGELGLLAGEIVEACDRPCDNRRIADSRRGGGQRPIRLGQRDHAWSRAVTADALVNARELRAVTVSTGAPDDVVRADHQ